MSDSQKYFTIPKLARRLGVTPASVREWIRRGLIEEPPALPVTGECAYPAEAAYRIEKWYLERASSGKTRGPKSAERRARARLLVASTSINGGEQRHE
jgi:transposase-like protein